MTLTPLKRLDSRQILHVVGEIRAFVAVRNEKQRLSCFLKHYRDLGVDRFFFADNLSNDGTVDYLLGQSDCHVFSAPGSYFAENVEPPKWTNALANVFGDGYWCVTVDADELLVYPHSSTVKLKDFCAFLDRENSPAVAGPMIDMYGPGPVAATRFTEGKHFLDSCPYFDPEPGWIRHVESSPKWQMFGGVRERVFWHNQPKENLPPCISKVPLVKWRKGAGYLISMHLHSGAKTSAIWCALLHFKFLSGFALITNEQVVLNQNIEEKGLSEKAIYLAALAVNPKLSLMVKQSTQYVGPDQLEKLGWIKSSTGYRRFVADLTRKSKKE